MFKETGQVDVTSVGLMPDVPSVKSQEAAWTESLNLRVKDGAIQGVNKFEGSFVITKDYDGTSNARAIAVAEWLPAGSEHLNIAYIIESQKAGEVGKGRVFVHNTNTLVTKEITNATVSDTFTIDERYPPQIFVTNEVLVINTGTGTPQYIAADETTNGNLDDIPGWAAAFPNRIARVVRPYGNRLVAMNFSDDAGTTTTADDKDYPVFFAWSSVFTTIGSISAIAWQKSTTNTAGFDFLTATPGGILDGKQLGNSFLAYKTDAVVRITETGNSSDPMSIESIFEDDGVYSSGCIADIGNSQHFIIGNYGVYMHNGQTEKQDAAKGIFQEAFFDSVNPSHKDRTFLFQQTRDKEVWLCYSSKTNTGLGCDEAYVMSYENAKLHKRSLPDVRDIFEAEVSGQLRIFAASPSNDNILLLSDSVFESDGYLTLENKLSKPLSSTKEVSSIYIDSEDSLLIAINGTTNATDVKTYTDLPLFNPADTHKVDTRISGRFINIRIKMSGASNPNITGLSLLMRASGRR